MIRNNRTPLRLALGALVLLAALPALAQDVEFGFTELGTLTPLSTLTIGDVGSTFSFSVAYATPNAFSHDGVNVFLGYDSTTSSGSGATPLDGKIGLVGSASGAVAGISSIFSSSATAALGGDTVSNGNELRPYGLNIALQMSKLRASTDEVRLFDVTLTNLGLLPGMGYDLLIYDAGDTGFADGTSTVNNATAIGLPSGSTALRLSTQPVPEPAPMLALAGGALVLLRRRRR